jgi:hypothetical protein
MIVPLHTICAMHVLSSMKPADVLNETPQCTRASSVTLSFTCAVLSHMFCSHVSTSQQSAQLQRLCFRLLLFILCLTLVSVPYTVVLSLCAASCHVPPRLLAMHALH